MATLMFIHGAFHKPSCWRKLVPLLERADIPYVLVDRSLPETSTRRSAVSWDPELEAKQIETIIDDNNIDGPVVLVGHSRGGDAVTFGGNHHQVVRLVYVAAHVPGLDVPDSITVTNPRLKEGFSKNDDRTWDCDPNIAKELFYSDCDDDELDDATLSDLLRPQAMPSKSPPVDLPPVAYKTKKSTYMICTRDQTTDPKAQQHWANLLKRDHGGDILELPTGHSPFWSNPQLLASHLIDIAKMAVAGDDKM